MSFKFPDGAYVVTVTPFNEDKTIDYHSFKKFLEWISTTSIAGVVLLGTTSESPTLTYEERKEYVKFAYKILESKKFIVVGVGGTSTVETVSFANFANDYSDAFMVTVPAYNKPPQRGMVEHFKAVANTVPSKPNMLYNVPGRTAANLLPETLVQILNECPNVTAIKDATGNSEQRKKMINLVNNNTDRSLDSTFKVFSGDDADIVDICRAGGRGVISVVGNITPEYITEEVQHCLDGDFDKAFKMANLVEPLIKGIFVDSNPIPIKHLMHVLDIYRTNEMRLPLVPMELESGEKLYQTFIEFNRNIVKDYEVTGPKN